EPLCARDAMPTLVANAYVSYLLDARMRRRDFVVLSRLLGTVPLRRATPHADASRLPEFCSAILADLAALTNAGSCPAAPRTAGV
ncbi:MAG TPA: hypothetical protein VKT77_16040, partial [Chthonomonadaceae bacterium]|nr:hypothetical protein [Chthonomonadaceae bacterium]